MSSADSVGGPVAGALEGFEATARIADGGGSVDLEARARRLFVESGGRSFALATPSMAARARRSPQDGRWAVTIEPSLSLVETASAAFTFDPASGEVADLVASLQGLDAAPLLAAAPLPPGWEVEGKLDLSARGGSEKLEYEAGGAPHEGCGPSGWRAWNGGACAAPGSIPERGRRELKRGRKRRAGRGHAAARRGSGGADGERLES